MKSFSNGGFAAVWASSRAWGGEAAAVGSGSCLLMGQALAGGKKSLRPEDVYAAWSSAGKQVPGHFEGIHMAAIFDGKRVRVGADPLGRFPVYYSCLNGGVVVASSPELFRSHPCWSGRLDTQALAGLLLLNYFQNGECLWDTVRRLGAGNMLIWSSTEALEVPQYRMTFSDENFGLSQDKQAEMVDARLREVIDDYLKIGSRCEMFMSGGLDSRMLAGYVEGNPALVRAITWGNPGDFELRCAKKAVNRIGLAHEIWPLNAAEYPLFAQRAIQWQGLSIGMNGLQFWQDRRTPVAPGGCLSGQALDAAVGGAMVLGIRENAGFRDIFLRDNSWAIPETVLRKLLRKEVFGGAIDTALDRMRREYEYLAEREFQRINAYGLMHRHRFHTSAVLGLHGLWGWPLLPGTDTRVLQVLRGLPQDSFIERKLQKHIVCTRFPELAKLPLDRNANHPRPLLPARRTWHAKLVESIARRMDCLSGRRDRERRFYYRVMDFNGPGWQKVRELAEPGRKRLEPLFNMDVFDRIVPPPGVPLLKEHIEIEPDLPHPDGVKIASGARLLTGLMLWARDRL